MPFRTLFDLGVTAGLTDGQLLERFACRRGEAAELAFAALVERHGPMVLRTCQSFLRDDHDAQDAFQATFLILVHRSGSLWVHDSLGPWLHRVARRVAARARVVSSRRKQAERRAAERVSERVDDRGRSQVDLGPELHAEIDRLPDRYRIPVVLCDLEGRTYEEAARLLGCRLGTLKSRLSRGRDRLRARLVRRGLAPSVGSPGVGLSLHATQAALPPALVAATARAATQVAAGEAMTLGITSAAIARLGQETLGRMTMTKTLAVASVLTLGIGLCGSGVLMVTGGATPSTARADDKPGAEPPKSDFEAIAQGTWVRVSVDGRRVDQDPDRLVKMVAKEAEAAPKAGDTPDGARWFVFEWTAGGQKASRNRVLLDPTRTPKTLDFFPVDDNKAAPRVCPGIYKLQGDTLTICFRAVQGERPTDFAAKPGEPWTLDVYEREKP
jgi:RNA polymerase sigma-70 factor (ECF subfamily)